VILGWHRNNELSKRLDAVAGVGPITATAMVASFGDGREFDNGRQMAACVGLVPRQHSSGGKTRLLGISKRGDVYLRMLAAVALANKTVRVIWALLAHGRTYDRNWSGQRAAAAA
jgi:transposase